MNEFGFADKIHDAEVSRSAAACLDMRRRFVEARARLALQEWQASRTALHTDPLGEERKEWEFKSFRRWRRMEGRAARSRAAASRSWDLSTDADREAGITRPPKVEFANGEGLDAAVFDHYIPGLFEPARQPGDGRGAPTKETDQ